MKQIEFSEAFVRNYKLRIQMDDKLSARFDERFKLFKQDNVGPPLYDHALKRNMKGLRDFSVTGDVRVIYREEDDRVVFLDIGIHKQVYR